MSTEQLNAALSFYFGRFLTAAQRETLTARADRVAVRLGAYTRYAGAPVPVLGGGTATPRFAIGVGPTLPLTNGIPAAGAAAQVGADARKLFLLWLRDLADIVADSREEIERVLHNLNYYVTAGDQRNAAAWATAVTGHAARASLNANPLQATALPQGFAQVAGTLEEYRETLLHFFTFDENGAYYPRWSGAGREIPAGLTEDYRRRNLMEFVLKRYDTYLYSVLPVRFLEPGAPAGRFREIVWGFRLGGDGAPAEARVLHTVERAFPNAGDFYDFVAFEAEEGEGAAMPVTARASIDARLADFLQDFQSAPADGEARTRLLADPNLMSRGAQPAVKMFARIRGQVTLPAGVVSLGGGEVRALMVPPDKVAEVGALAQVEWLEAPRPLYPRLATARPMVRWDALQAKLPAGKKGGAGAVVGVVDSGLDAQHPGFAGRVLGVWDQANAAGPTPASAFNAGGSGIFDAIGDAVRNAFYGYGTEFTGATVTNARDTGEHGTHVTGIAAGAAVAGANPVPEGMAPQAQIVMVHRGQPAPDPTDFFSEQNRAISDFDLYTAIGYIQEKATRFREGTPVVVNMSFGHHDHAHDGTAPLSRGLRDMVKQGTNWTRGLILVAAAGNERTDRRHIQRTVAAAAGATPTTQTFDFDLTGMDSRSRFAEVVTIWVTNPTPASASIALDATTSVPGTASTTSTYSQRPTHAPDWTTFAARGIHLGTSFGPKDPENNDFNIRIRLQTARALVRDPAGAITLLGNKFRLVALNRNWQIAGTTTDIFSVPNSIIVPLGPTTIPAGASPAITAALTTLNGLTTRTLRVTLRNRSASALDYHVWAGRENAAFQGVTAADVSHLICTPADSEGVIAVAACNANLATGTPGTSFDSNPEGAITSFSSPGPLRKQPANAGIDITAPGNMIVSTASAHVGATDPMRVNANAVRMAGTSMASPAIAGLIANVLADNPALTTQDIRTRFATCSIPTKLRDGVTNMPAGLPVSANDWGKGLIDAEKLKP